MAFDKPTRVARFGGTSAAETANSAEPASGKKDLGWELDEEPPSSTFNWLHYRAYKWFRWLDERIDDVTTAVNLAIHAPPVALTSDDGGDLTLSAADSGTDADKNGGDATLSGGDATGIGSSSVFLAAATKGVTGTAARVAETYLKLNGLDLAGPTTYGKVEIPKSLTVFTPAGSDGPAIIADASAGTARALTVRSKFVTPTTAPLGVNPQTADPSIPLSGDVYVNNDSDQIAHYGALGRFQNLDSIVEATKANSTEIVEPDAETPFDQTYTVPGNTLREGSVIRVRAHGFMTWSTGTSFSVRAHYGIDPLSSSVRVNFGAGTNQRWSLVADCTFRTIGVAGSFRGSNRMETALGSPTTSKDWDFAQSTAVGVDTTGNTDITVDVQIIGGDAGDKATMASFVVDVI